MPPGLGKPTLSAHSLRHLNVIFEPISRTGSAVTWNLAYTPPNPAIDNLMQAVGQRMNIIPPTVSFATENEMNMALIADTSRLNFLAGIIFENVAATDAQLPENLNFRIRFPAESRAVMFAQSTNALVDNWQTDLLFPLFSEGGPRNRESSEGGRPPGYYEERFITIQSAISESFIAHKATELNHLGVNLSLMLRRFSYPPTTVDFLLIIMQVFVSLILFLSFLYPAINNVKVSLFAIWQ